jgi:hypothetical protein
MVRDAVLCTAPHHEALKEEGCPTTALGRITNFVLYHIVEPILPGKSEQVEVAQDTHAVAGPR